MATIWSHQVPDSVCPGVVSVVVLITDLSILSFDQILSALHKLIWVNLDLLSDTHKVLLLNDDIIDFSCMVKCVLK